MPGYDLRKIFSAARNVISKNKPSWAASRAYRPFILGIWYSLETRQMFCQPLSLQIAAMPRKFATVLTDLFSRYVRGGSARNNSSWPIKSKKEPQYTSASGGTSGPNLAICLALTPVENKKFFEAPKRHSSTAATTLM